jgi:hypothetical protein
MLVGAFPACAIDKDAAHGRSCRAKEMLPNRNRPHYRGVGEERIGFMNQSRAVEHLAWLFVCQRLGGESPKVVVGQWQKLIRHERFAGLPIVRRWGESAHDRDSFQNAFADRKDLATNEIFERHGDSRYPLDLRKARRLPPPTGKTIGGGNLISTDLLLLQLDRPVGVVEEGPPRLILAVRHLEVQQGAALGLFRLANEVHVRLFRGAAALADVAVDASADDVLPTADAALAARDDVIEAQFGGWELLAAVLALIVVACEDVAAIELHRLLRQPVVVHQANDARHLNLAVDGVQPIVVHLTEVTRPILAHFAPSLEIVGQKLTVFQTDYFSKILTKQTKGPPNGNNVYGHEQLVQNQDTSVQGGTGTGVHEAPFLAVPRRIDSPIVPNASYRYRGAGEESGSCFLYNIRLRDDWASTARLDCERVW